MKACTRAQAVPLGSASRLDEAIAYYRALIALLDEAADAVAGLDGPVLVIGLGNGRSLDHLREKLPDHRFLAFDRQDRAHPGSRPAEPYLFLASAGQDIENALTGLGGPAAMIHCDYRYGLSGDERHPPLHQLAESLAPGGLLTLEWPEATLSLTDSTRPEVRKGDAPGLFLMKGPGR